MKITLEVSDGDISEQALKRSLINVMARQIIDDYGIDAETMLKEAIRKSVENYICINQNQIAKSAVDQIKRELALRDLLDDTRIGNKSLTKSTEKFLLDSTE